MLQVATVKCVNGWDAVYRTSELQTRKFLELYTDRPKHETTHGLIFAA